VYREVYCVESKDLPLFTISQKYICNEFSPLNLPNLIHNFYIYVCLCIFVNVLKCRITDLYICSIYHLQFYNTYTYFKLITQKMKSLLLFES